MTAARLPLPQIAMLWTRGGCDGAPFLSLIWIKARPKIAR
jgi:hypothetical protein